MTLYDAVTEFGSVRQFDIYAWNKAVLGYVWLGGVPSVYEKYEDEQVSSINFDRHEIYLTHEINDGEEF